jgi:predicted amidohydrolase YtcJ
MQSKGNYAMPADIILKNARVITMDAAQPVGELVAISGDKIAFVGGDKELDSLVGAGTRIIDCRGRAVLPGFNDAHLHLFSLVRKLLSIDLSPSSVRSIADIKEAVRKKAESTPPGTWISGTDYNEFYLAEKRCPTRYDLDEVAPEHPVVLSHRSLHACVLNSLALSLAGINAETPEPPGARIERDLATGEPSGILIDMLDYIRSKVMPPLSDADLNEGIALANKLFLSYGITSFQDATYKNDPNRWRMVREFQETGKLRSRGCMMAGPGTRHQFKEAGMITGSGDNNLRLGAVKFLLEVQPEQGELNQLVLACHREGWQLAFHAVAESSVAAAIASLENVAGHAAVVGRRHRIEHCGECPPYLLERLKKLDAVIVTQPPFIYYSGERYLATVPESQLPWLYRVKSPLESGIVVAGSSDTPVVPHNPMMGIYAAITRRTESGQTLLLEEAISPGQALALYTANAAYASFEENIKGSLSPGKLADIVILSDDPTRVPPKKIKDIKVEMTIIGGEVVWEG